MNWDSMLKAAVTVGVIVVIGGALVWVACNDISIIGVLDDVAIPGLTVLLTKLFE